MKIGLVCPYSVAKPGGVQEIIFNLYQQLTARGHRVKLITPCPLDLIDKSDLDRKNFREKIAQQNQVFRENPTLFDDLILLGRGADFSSRNLQTTGQISTSNRRAIRTVLTAERFDVLHFHEPWVPFLAPQMLQENAKLGHSRAATIGTFHANLPDTKKVKLSRKIIQPFAKNVLKYLDVLTAVSFAAAEFAHAVSGCEITIIPNGINITKFRERVNLTDNTSEQNLCSKIDLEFFAKTDYILYVGRLDPRKGLVFLLSAFAELAPKYPDLELIIAGDGSQKTELKTFVKEHQIPRVEFVGFVSDREKIWLLQHATLFCSPATDGESFGIVLLEAMAAGVPIVAGNNSGYMAVLGLPISRKSLIDPRDSAVFTTTLKQFLDDQKFREKWLTWAKTDIEKYDFAKIADAYEKVYMTAVEQCSRGKS